MYTQNIDMLEEKAGVLPSKIVYCHGNTQSVTCMRCKAVTSVVRDDEKIMARILSGKVPHCDAASEAPLATKKPKLERQSSRNSARQHDKNYLSSDRTSPPLSPSLCNGVLKPSITFFGEKPAYNLTRMLNLDKKACDGLIVVGTSLAVAPMSCVMKFLKDVPRCLINRDDVPIVEGGGEFEVKCFGNVDAVVDEDATFEATEGGEVSAARNEWANCYSLSTLRDRSSDATSVSANGALLVLPLASHLSLRTRAPPHTNSPVPQFLFEGATFDGSQQIDPLVQPLVGVSCDSCGQDIEPPEEVFVCVQCFCFDLCEGCLKGAQETHMDGKHTFVAEDHAS